MSRQEAIDAYSKALKAAHKEFKDLTAAGLPTYPAVLDTILPETIGDTYQEVGLVEIPVSRIVGTKSAGRTPAFTASFLPLLEINTEFAAKWISLCDAHLTDEGIRDPIECYEYLGNFYIQEGNKRLSVLKAFDAARIPANVRRILPLPSDDPRIKAYYEFLEFYKDSGLYEVQYHTPGNYAKLLSALGKEPGEAWTQWEKRTFCAYLQYFRNAFFSLGGETLPLLPEEALLVWLEVYTFRDLGKLSETELKKTLSGLWENIKSPDAPVQMNTAAQENSGGILGWIRSGLEHLHIAFVHQLSPETSPWTKAHDEGRLYMEQQLCGKVNVKSYFHADSPEATDTLLEEAISDGAQLVFTTTPRLSRATLKASIRYPKVRFFNCSVNLPYSSIRSYYGRIYEAKFITGAIAGAMADNDRIGYIGNYPIYGVPASINAFALGAQLTNPRARVDLRWSCQSGDAINELIHSGCQVISNRDVPTLSHNYLEFGEYGTYFVNDGALTPLASPCWLWGTFYEKVARALLHGTLESGKEALALNYWWGVESGVIDVVLSEKLPESMRCLAEMLRSNLRQGTLDPFFRRIVQQDGSVMNDGSRHFTPEELLKMDWLCENVDGIIPEFSDVLPFAQPLLRELGIHKESIPPEKEADML